MKKAILILLFIITIGLFSACSTEPVKPERKEPEIAQIRSICNLATLECYYHNVAKSTKKAQSGFFGIGEEDRKFWIEYTGTAKIGIDMTKVDMTIDADKVTVTLPKAELLSVNVDPKELNENSYIASEDAFFNSNKITATDQTNAIKNAQAEMENSVKSNSTLLLNAQNRAKDLIENYIVQLGKLSNVEYKIEWIYENQA